MNKKGLIIILSVIGALGLLLVIGIGTEKDIPKNAIGALIETGNCSEVMPEDTTLEFWITDNVEGFNFTNHDEISGWIGAREYLGSSYQKTVDSDGTDSKPNYYVSYLVTAYPDYADGGKFVTRIEITDPEIKVYGLTVNSTMEDFNSVFENLGFTLSDGESTACHVRIAEKNGITFTLTKEKDGDVNIVPQLVIRAEVTNRDRIQY